MRILITNDDGIEARGIRILIETAKKFGEVLVVAPESQQSGVSMGITLHSPMRISEYDGYEGVRAWTVGGKPADCVKVAFDYLKLDVDVVLSGINDGPNLGTDVMYSGTVAGASEALVFNIPSIAISTDFGCFDIAENETYGILCEIFKNYMPAKGKMLNVNFPSGEYRKSLGVRFTRQGSILYNATYRYENGMYWQEGEIRKQKNGLGTDVRAFEEGYTSITPLGIDRTDYKLLEILNSEEEF